jgi:hypothetical protein
MRDLIGKIIEIRTEARRGPQTFVMYILRHNTDEYIGIRYSHGSKPSGTFITEQEMNRFGWREISTEEALTSNLEGTRQLGVRKLQDLERTND